MTPKSTHNKAREKRIAENFYGRNPGKVPLKVQAIHPKQTELAKMERKYRHAAELVCIANDLLERCYSMYGRPHSRIAYFAKQYLKKQK